MKVMKTIEWNYWRVENEIDGELEILYLRTNVCSPSVVGGVSISKEEYEANSH